MENKKILRKQALTTRKTLNIEKLSKTIVEKIQLLKEFKKAQHILIYCPFNYEINLLSLVCEEKNFYLPKINEDKKTLSIFSYKEQDCLIKNPWGISEPDEKKCNSFPAQKIDLVIVPALMADKKGFRLGYGKGFYDRLIPKLDEKCTKIVAIAHCLICEELPKEAHDSCVDFVVSEEEIFEIRS